MAQPPRKMQWMARVPHGLSASQFGAALGFSGRVSDYVIARVTYVNTALEFRGNAYTQHGIVTEAKSRALYEMLTGCAVHDGGFYVTDDELLACTPDGVVYVNEDDEKGDDEDEGGNDTSNSSTTTATTTCTASNTTTTRSGNSDSSNSSSASSTSLLTWSGALDAQRLLARDVPPSTTHCCGAVPFARAALAMCRHSSSYKDDNKNKSNGHSANSSSNNCSGGGAAATTTTASTAAHARTHRSRHNNNNDTQQQQERRRRQRLLEIKSPCHALYMTGKAYTAPFGIPLTYMCQIQGQMAIADVDECDFFVYLDSTTHCHVEAWRVRRSRAFWSWAEPKLRQVCAWMAHLATAVAAASRADATKTATTTAAAASDDDGNSGSGGSEGVAAAAVLASTLLPCPRSFAFVPFDFATIDVTPLVYPFNIGAASPLTDARRFAFFCAHNSTASTTTATAAAAAAVAAAAMTNSKGNSDDVTRKDGQLRQQPQREELSLSSPRGTTPYARVRCFTAPTADDDVLTAIAKMTYSPAVRFLFGPRSLAAGDACKATTTTATAKAAATTLAAAGDTAATTRTTAVSAAAAAGNKDGHEQEAVCDARTTASASAGVLCSSFVSSLDSASLRSLVVSTSKSSSSSNSNTSSDDDEREHDDEDEEQTTRAQAQRMPVYVTLLRNDDWHTGKVQVLLHAHDDDNDNIDDDAAADVSPFVAVPARRQRPRRHRCVLRTSPLRTTPLRVRAHCRAFFASLLSTLHTSTTTTTTQAMCSMPTITTTGTSDADVAAAADATTTPLPCRHTHTAQQLHDATMRIALVPTKARRAEVVYTPGDTYTTPSAAAATTTTVTAAATAVAVCTPPHRPQPVPSCAVSADDTHTTLAACHAATTTTTSAALPAALTSLPPLSLSAATRPQQPQQQTMTTMQQPVVVVPLVPHEKTTSLTQCIRLSLTPQRPARTRDEVDVDAEVEYDTNDGDDDAATAAPRALPLQPSPHTTAAGNTCDDDDDDAAAAAGVLVEPVVQLIDHEDLLELVESAVDCREVIVLHDTAHCVDCYPRPHTAAAAGTLSSRVYSTTSPLPRYGSQQQQRLGHAQDAARSRSRRRDGDGGCAGDEDVDVDCQFVLLIGPGAVVEQVVQCAAQELQQLQLQQQQYASTTTMSLSCVHSGGEKDKVRNDTAATWHHSVRALVQRLAECAHAASALRMQGRLQQQQQRQQPYDKDDRRRDNFVLCYVEEPHHVMRSALTRTSADSEDNNSSSGGGGGDVAEYRDALLTPCFVVRDMTWSALRTRIERTLHAHKQ